MSVFKKIILSACILTCTATFPFCTNAYASELDSAAKLDISQNVEGCYSDIESLHQDGVRVYDTAGLLTQDERENLNEILDRVCEDTGFDTAVFTANDISGYNSTADFADDIYDNSGFGTGDDRTGTILVMETFDDGSAYISTAGEAVRYITDEGINYIFDDIADGSGVWTCFEDGEYYKACMLYAQGVEELYSKGIESGQYNYDTETGEIDTYHAEKKHSLDLFEVLAAFIISIIGGVLPVKFIRSSYSMRNEKAAADGINQAYMAVSSYKNAGADSGKFIRKFVTSRHIAPPPSGGSGGHINGGGMSSVHKSAGGVTHGGGGRGSR